MTGRPARVWKALVCDDTHGPLPALLVVLTLATGVIDAASFLGLGQVFVANMTGNLAFVGFALAGTPDISLTASLAALGGFLLGAAGKGPLVARWRRHRGRLLRNATMIEIGLIAIGIVVAAVAPPVPGSGREWTVAAPLAIAMGVQNAGVRGLGVPDMTTTVFTTTLTGIAADWRTTNTAALSRRSFGVLALLVGALVGALLMLSVGLGWTLGLGVVLIGLVAVVATLHSRRPQGWHLREQRAG